MLATSPTNGGIAATHAPILIRFSETMDTRAAEASFSYGDGFSLYTIADGTVSWIATSSPDDTIRFSPRLEFASGGGAGGDVNRTPWPDGAGEPLCWDAERTGTGHACTYSSPGAAA